MSHNLTHSPDSDLLPCSEGCQVLIVGFDRLPCPCGDGWVCALCEAVNCDHCIEAIRGERDDAVTRALEVRVKNCPHCDATIDQLEPLNRDALRFLDTAHADLKFYKEAIAATSGGTQELRRKQSERLTAGMLLVLDGWEPAKALLRTQAPTTSLDLWSP